MKKRIFTSLFGIALLIGGLTLNTTESEAMVVRGKRCVCKRSRCEPGALISFRKGCNCSNNLDKSNVPTLSGNSGCL